MSELLLGLSACCFIIGLAFWPTRYERLRGETIHAPVTLFVLSALLLVGAAYT